MIRLAVILAAIGVTLAAPVVLILGGAWPASYVAASPDHRICYYADSPSTPFGAGHGFVQLLPGAGEPNPQAGRKDLVYGKYPASWSPFNSDGEIRQDNKHSWDWKICYTVSVASYNAVVGLIRGEITAPSDYHLFSDNCVDWITQSETLAGVVLPETDNKLSIPDPYAFEDSLEDIGDGNVFGGGTVKENTTGVAPDSGVDPPGEKPDVCSYDGLVSFGLDDSSALASALNLESHEETLPSIPVELGQVLTVQLENVDTGNAITVIDFGDGSVAEQVAAAPHAYSLAGDYDVTAVVLDSGAVNEFTFTAHVSGQPGQTLLSLEVPDPPANAPFPPSDPALNPEYTSIGTVVGGVAEFLPPEPDSSPVAGEDSSSSAPFYAAIAGGAALLMVIAGGAGWYARRRWLR